MPGRWRSCRSGAEGEALLFYNQYGVEEYYLYDPEPEQQELTGFRRDGTQLVPIANMDGQVSPRLGIRFDMSGPASRLFAPDNELFRSHQELAEERAAERAARQPHARCARAWPYPLQARPAPQRGAHPGSPPALLRVRSS